MSCSQCDHCRQDQFVADRLSIWNTAYAALHSDNKEWPETEPVSAHDVFLLAQLLAGDTIGNN